MRKNILFSWFLPFLIIIFIAAQNTANAQTVMKKDQDSILVFLSKSFKNRDIEIIDIKRYHPKILVRNAAGKELIRKAFLCRDTAVRTLDSIFKVYSEKYKIDVKKDFNVSYYYRIIKNAPKSDFINFFFNYFFDHVTFVLDNIKDRWPDFWNPSLQQYRNRFPYKYNNYWHMLSPIIINDIDLDCCPFCIFQKSYRIYSVKFTCNTQPCEVKIMMEDAGKHEEYGSEHSRKEFFIDYALGPKNCCK